ncbi:MAG: hypothetical protein KKF68_02220 [Nanoarchaeota archaeon]|nr:hypothetical protein [Nanoarchaeota archaeon]
MGYYLLDVKISGKNMKAFFGLFLPRLILPTAIIRQTRPHTHTFEFRDGLVPEEREYLSDKIKESGLVKYFQFRFFD